MANKARQGRHGKRPTDAEEGENVLGVFSQPEILGQPAKDGSIDLYNRQSGKDEGSAEEQSGLVAINLQNLQTFARRIPRDDDASLSNGTNLGRCLY